MDLLGGYKSDGDSSSASSSYSHQQNQNHPPQRSNPALTERQPPNQSDVAAVFNQKQQQQQQQQQNKGKRLLKLNAVLPPDILERLTRSTVNRKGSNSAANGDEWSESDSSESEDEILRGHEGYDHQGNISSSRRINKTSRPFATTRTTTNNNKFKQREDSKKDPVSDMMDSDLSSLLDDLKSHVPSVGPSKVEVAEGGKEEKLGMAFMKVVSSSVVRRKRTEKPLPAVDIHGHSGSWQSKLPDNATMDNRVPERKPQELMEESDHEEKVMAIEQPSVPSRRHRAVVGMKRARNAAPSVSTSTLSTPFNTEVDDQVTQQPIQAVGPSHDVQQQQHQQEYEANGESIPSLSNSSKKRSKRELEKALRAGDFDALQDCTHKIEAPNQIPHNASSLVLEGGGGGGSGGSSFRSSGLERYVPSEGTTVKQTGLSAKMRGKHQIHSLVVSASKYDADQRRMAVMGMGGQQGKSKRADAKKKYGW